MKKKRILVIVGICALIIILGGTLLLAKNDIHINVGTCVVADNGRHLIVIDNSPVVMHQRSGDKDIFSGLETGDKILIVNDGIAEMLPGKTGVYFLLKVGGNATVPNDVIDTLKDLEWINNNEIPVSTSEDNRIQAYQSLYSFEELVNNSEPDKI